MLNFEVIPTGTFYFDIATPRNDFETGAQQLDRETGLPKWSIAALHRAVEDRRTEQVAITVLSKEDPNTLLTPMAPIEFEGLRVMSGQGNSGTTWVSLSAKGVKPAGAAPAQHKNSEGK